MWILHKQSKSCTRNWLGRAFLLALFCGSVFARADTNGLSQAEVEDAISEAVPGAVEDALFAVFTSYLINNPYAFRSYPLDTQGRNLSRYLIGEGSLSIPGSVGRITQRILDTLLGMTNSNDRVEDVLYDIYNSLGFVDDGSGTLQYMLGGQILPDLDHIAYQTEILQALSFRGDVHGNELLVAAPDLEALLSSNSPVGRLIGNALTDNNDQIRGVRDELEGLIPAISNIVFDASDRAVHTINDVEEEDVVDAEDYASGTFDNEEEAAIDYYDSLDLPEADGDEDPDVDFDDPGLSDSDFITDFDSVSHSPILQLVSGGVGNNAEEIVPSIEVDFGRDPGFTSFCSRMDTLTNWLYPILGTFFLSLKALRMWRLVRQASVFAASNGTLPNMHLGWDPF